MSLEQLFDPIGRLDSGPPFPPEVEEQCASYVTQDSFVRNSLRKIAFYKSAIRFYSISFVGGDEGLLNGAPVRHKVQFANSK